MKAKIEVELKPFVVPNFAITQDGEHDNKPTSVPLSALDATTLDRMCDDFRDAVFANAGVKQPARLAR